MSEKKDVRTPEETRKDSPNTEGYRFIKETIKDKPVNRKNLIIRIAAITGSAILFGVAAAIGFAIAQPIVSAKIEENQDPPNVDIDVTEPTETATPVPEQESEVVEIPRSITLDDYEKIYEEVRKVAEKPLKSLVTVTGVAEDEDVLDNSYVQYGQSSGVIIAKNEEEIYVLTEKTALDKESQKVHVTFCDGLLAEGALRKSDEGTGLAVVAVPVENVKESTKNEIAVAALGNSYSLMQGKPVIAIGSPSGYNESVAYGTIISVANKVSVVDAEYNLLVTDILGSKQGSGVLLDTSGSVIGVIAQSFGETNSDTMVKAFSVAQLKSLLACLSNGKKIHYVGIYGQDVTEEMAKNTKGVQGIYVDSVEKDSPAMTAGIQSADVITEFNGVKISSMQKFSTQLQKCKTGQKVTIKLMRRGSDGYAEMEFDIATGTK